MHMYEPLPKKIIINPKIKNMTKIFKIWSLSNAPFNTQLMDLNEVKYQNQNEHYPVLCKQIHCTLSQ